MAVNKNIEKSLDEILLVNGVLAVLISSYDGLIIFDKGIEKINRKKVSVEVAKIAKVIKSHLPEGTKTGITLTIYYKNYNLVISFFEDFVISLLCGNKANMGFLKIKLKNQIPLIRKFL